MERIAAEEQARLLAFLAKPPQLSPVKTSGKAPCFQWQKGGTCSRGNNCTFSHDPSQPHQSAGPRPGGRPCYRWNSADGCPYGKECSFDHVGPGKDARTDLCRDFSRGICNRGPSCRFYHSAAAPSPHKSPHPPKELAEWGRDARKRTERALNNVDEERAKRHRAEDERHRAVEDRKVLERRLNSLERSSEKRPSSSKYHGGSSRSGKERSGSRGSGA